METDFGEIPYDFNCRLWGSGEHFYRELIIEPFLQAGLTCVSTALGSLSGSGPEHFLGLQKNGKLNTHDPVSWSEALKPFGMKLAYLPFDTRKLRFYMDELVELDDLFLLAYYSGMSLEMLKDPDDNGYLCESHVVILHRDQIIDPALGESRPAVEHWCNGCHTKRLFRVVPHDHRRGL
jgi:hypothetical protein